MHFETSTECNTDKINHETTVQKISQYFYNTTKIFQFIRFNGKTPKCTLKHQQNVTPTLTSETMTKHYKIFQVSFQRKYFKCTLKHQQNVTLTR
jgi:hypothetical protein